MTMARAIDLTHSYSTVTALEHVDLDVHAGELIGMLGPNGAGKSTLLSLFTGLRRPTSGTVELMGGNPRNPRNRRSIGVTPQDTALPATLRVSEVINYVAAHFDNPLQAPELTERFGLSSLLKRQTGGLSGGQRRRLAVALAFIGRPKLVFLDEPTTGLDVEGRNALWEAIQAFHNDGGTVVLTSHYLAEIEALAQRVVVVNHGHILADDTVDAICGQVGGHKVSYVGDPPTGLAGVISTRHQGGRTELFTTNPDELVRSLVHNEIGFSKLAISQASLEDAFLSLTAAA